MSGEDARLPRRHIGAASKELPPRAHRLVCGEAASGNRRGVSYQLDDGFGGDVLIGWADVGGPPDQDELPALNMLSSCWSPSSLCPIASRRPSRPRSLL